MAEKDHDGVRRTAVVTGAAGGVGSHLVRSLIDQDWQVTAIVRPGTDSSRLRGLQGAQISELDLGDSEAVDSWGRDYVDANRSLGLLVNTAAIAVVGPVAESTPQQWHDVFSTNVIAPAALTDSLLPGLREAHGTVVFINSGAGERAVQNHAIYAASKHALRGYANTLRIEESGNGIRVASVYPGQISTPMLKGIDDRLGVVYEPELYINPQTVANTVIWIADAPADVHISNVDLRPRQEVSARFNV